MIGGIQTRFASHICRALTEGGAGKEMMMDRIVLAIDGSEHSDRAARMAGELSNHFGALVDVINVVPDPVLVSPTGAFGEYAALENVNLTQRDLLESAGAETIARAAEIVGQADGNVDRTEVLIGSPAQSIVSYAENAGADCIVMGRRGLGDLSGLLMGSVTHRVGHLTDIDLVTVA